MGVTVTYKGNTIASMNADGTKTLKTGGKYCEGDIGVEYTAPTTSCITATFTVTSPFANQGVTLISGNSFIAANYNNSKAFALVVKVSDLSMNGINMAFCTNQQFGVLSTSNNTPVFGWFNGNTGTVSATANRIVNSLSTQNTTVGNMYANSNGDLVLRVGSGTNAFQTGNYFIIFGLME